MTQQLSDRQDELQTLLEQGGQIPGVEQAMAAYEEIQRSVVRVVRAQSLVTYSTGGNA